jgi:hypothetical protein
MVVVMWRDGGTVRVLLDEFGTSVDFKFSYHVTHT